MDIEKLLEKEKLTIPEASALVEDSLQALIKLDKASLCLHSAALRKIALNIHAIHNKFLKPLDITMDDIAATLETITQKLKDYEA